MGSTASSSTVLQGTGLPTELTRFIGRERELVQLRGLLGDARLITLTGPAGSGKTRLALELVTRADPDGPPVYWVELAALRDPGLVARAVAEAAGVREEIRSGDTATLGRLLGGGATLLVLDNCEHLVDACAELADRLLHDCPKLAIIATSREALGVRGERAWLVPPLGVPGPDDDSEPAGSESVRLFVERARDVAPGFVLTPETEPVVAEICRRLDGIPLAIELAAARIKVLSPADIRDRLDDVFRLLTSGGRTAVPRHRTLRAAIDWSHDLLIEDARTLLRRLAVFRGGFTLDGAEQVGSGEPLTADGILDLVARLVDRSMLGVGEHHGATRYTFLEAVRQYATQKLQASGEEPEVRGRHAAWVLARVEEAEPHFTRRERRAWVDQLQPELDNIRSALAWSRDHDPKLHVRLVGKLWWFWFSTRHWTEGGRWIQGALELPEASGVGEDRAALVFAAGALAALQVRTPEARPHLEEAVALSRELGDERLEAYALNYLGLTYAGEGRAEAVALCGRAEAWFREHGDLYGLRLAALLLGSAALGRGDLETAEAWNREGVRVARLFGQNRELAVALQNLAAVHLTQGQLDRAAALIREAMAASLKDPSLYFIATGLSYQGEIEAGWGRHRESARLLGAAEGVRDRIGAVAFPLDRRRQEAVVDGLRNELGAAEVEVAWEEGRSRDVDALVRELAGESAAAGPPGPGAPRDADVGVPGVADAPAVVSSPGPVGPERATVAGDGTGESAVELRVDALGPFVAHVHGAPLDPERWVYAKPRELLTYLLLNPRGGTRDQIGEALWPGSARSNMKNSFHVTLHHLRKTLGHAGWIITEADRYRLDPELGYAFDVDTFERRARRALRELDGRDGPAPIEELRSALALYRGDLLEGETVGRWIDDDRDRLRRVQVELTLALGAALEADDPGVAAELYQRLAAREALDEEVHRRLMAAWAQSGNRAGAIRHFERVVDLLRSELDAEPEAETVALYETIRGG